MRFASRQDAVRLLGKFLRQRGIYDCDPKKNPRAKRFAEISCLDALQRQLKVMDSTAFSLCMDNKMPIIVFDFSRPHNLKRVLLGEKVGTLVTS
jgi:uridylate kinase